MSREKQGFWEYLLVGSSYDERKAMVLEYVIHRVKAGARLGEVLEEEYVRRHASKEELDELICNPELVHAARVHLESALKFETSQPRSPSRYPGRSSTRLAPAVVGPQTEGRAMPANPGHEEGLSQKLGRGAPLAAVVLVVSAVVLFLIYELLPVLKLIAIALLLALAMRTVVRGLDRASFPTWLSAIVLLFGIGAFGALVWLVMVPNLSQEVRQLTSEGPGSLQSVANLFRDLPLFPDASRLSERLRGYLSGLIDSLPMLLYTAGSAVAAVVAVVFLALYLAIDPDAYTSGILRFVPRARHEGVEDFIDRVGTRLRGWISGVAFVASFVGLGAGLGLWLLGVLLPLTLGLLAGLLNVIPFAGSVLGGALATLVALTISPLTALEVAVLFLVLNQIEGNILQPQVMSRQVRISTAVFIVAFLVLGTLLRPIIGAFLAVPATVVTSVVLDELAAKRPSLGFDEEGEETETTEERKTNP